MQRSERGDAYPLTLFEGSKGARQLETERQAYMARLFADTVGFAAAKTVRRILGLARLRGFARENADFEIFFSAK